MSSLEEFSRTTLRADLSERRQGESDYLFFCLDFLEDSYWRALLSRDGVQGGVGTETGKWEKVFSWSLYHHKVTQVLFLFQDLYYYYIIIWSLHKRQISNREIILHKINTYEIAQTS